MMSATRLVPLGQRCTRSAATWQAFPTYVWPVPPGTDVGTLDQGYLPRPSRIRVCAADRE
jgi:hypothetical protein